MPMSLLLGKMSLSIGEDDEGQTINKQVVMATTQEPIQDAELL